MLMYFSGCLAVKGKVEDIVRDVASGDTVEPVVMMNYHALYAGDGCVCDWFAKHVATVDAERDQRGLK